MWSMTRDYFGIKKRIITKRGLFMKKYIIYACLVFLSGISSNAFSEPGNGMPLKYISSCEMDFNNDEKSDIALLVETSRGRELIVLMNTISEYNAFVVSRGKPNMYLSCHFGKAVKETAAGKGKGEGEGEVYKTMGTYIKLTQPEGSSVVYFWNGNGFKEVWTSD